MKHTTTIKDITSYLEQLAPLAYQEHYDNAGLLVGHEDTPVTGVLICLDVTEAVLQEAQEKNCNFIVAHHPIIFAPLRKLTGTNPVERCVLQAIRQNTAIYAVHTNLDNAWQGVNHHLAATLGLTQLSILAPKKGILGKLIPLCPLPTSKASSKRCTAPGQET